MIIFSQTPRILSWLPKSQHSLVFKVITFGENFSKVSVSDGAVLYIVRRRNVDITSMLVEKKNLAYT